MFGLKRSISPCQATDDAGIEVIAQPDPYLATSNLAVFHLVLLKQSCCCLYAYVCAGYSLYLFPGADTNS